MAKWKVLTIETVRLWVQHARTQKGKKKKRKVKREKGGLTDAYQKAINIYIYKYSEFSTDYISKGLKMCSELQINKNIS